MVDLSTLISICQTALSAGSKLIEASGRRKLSHEERGLLMAAAEKGEFHVISVGQPPYQWIRSGSKDFSGDNDPAISAMYVEAFRSLCERGLIEHKGGTFFMLTGTGFKTARSLNEA